MAATLATQRPDRAPVLRMTLKDSPCYIGVPKGDAETLERVNAIIQDAMSVLGLTVVGAITASYVNFTITAQYTSKYSTINFQEVLDGIFPKLIPMCLVLLGFYLLKFKKFSAIKLIGVYLIISILLGLIGIV